MSSGSGSGSGADASDRDAALDRLSGPELVAHLRVTCRRADYDAAARVLAARDRRLADAEARLAEVRPGLADALAQLQALREEYLALRAARCGPTGRPSGSGGAIAGPAPRGDMRTEVIDFCDSRGDDDDGDWEEGEFRPDVAGVSCKAKGRRAGDSCKRKAPVNMDSSDADDEDDRIPLSQLIKKRRGAEPVPNGEPKKGQQDVQANSVGPLGDHPPERPPVNRGDPEPSAGQRAGASPQLKVANLANKKGDICQPREGGGLSRTMPAPPPTDSAAKNSPRKKFSKVDGAEDGGRIGNKGGSAAGPPFQVRTPSHTDTARRIVESARAGADTPNVTTGSAPDATINLVPDTIREQGRTNGGMHKMKAPLETNGIAGKSCVVPGAIREQQKSQSQVLNIDVLSGTNGIGKQSGKLTTCQDNEVSDRGRLRTSDKAVSASLQPNNQLTLHSKQMPVESSLPTSLQQNNLITLHSEQKPVESSLPSEVTRHWKSASDVYTSCLANNDICMQAACALLRQKKLTIQGGRSDFRAAGLAEFLLDGNLQGPLKRTAEELVKHDSGGQDLLGRVAMGFSEQLFSIYRNKEDPYFR
ncbi:uncharacterized protein LOC120674892 [Panicum virgatum]|uniref:uncharacterized protein LOC120674892 n=1 Tax=Panicum virgatum TaxID=38727 RepID=UPI0019D60EAA|nr:uncharacterized protein LOC120674892 [Panicum virgatum]